MLEFHLEKLITFVGVVDAGSIRRYATAQRLSQPGVSQRISGLERLLGLHLLNRSRSGVGLTPQGRAVYELGQKLVGQTQQVEAQLYGGSAKEMELKFGTYDSVAIYLMPGIIHALRQRLPHVHLKLVCDRSTNIIQQVSEGSLHIGLCVALKSSRKVVVHPLYDDHYGFYLSTNGGEERSLVTMGEAAPDRTGKDLQGLLKAMGLRDYHFVTAPSFEVAKALTLAGLGIGVLPHRVAKQSLLSGDLRRATPRAGAPASFGRHSFGYVASRGTMELAETKVLLSLIQAALGNKPVGA